MSKSFDLKVKRNEVQEAILSQILERVGDYNAAPSVKALAEALVLVSDCKLDGAHDEPAYASTPY